MGNILCIETGTDICSVGLARGGETVALRESSQRDHARLAAAYVAEVLASEGISPTELSAVAVSKGPGSYTGLRIGVSLAKGLCYGLGIPLIGINSLACLQAIVSPAGGAGGDEKMFIPMIDARRMEVYCQVFDGAGRAVTEVEAKIITEEGFAEYRGADVYIFGDGAEKCREVLPWAKFVDVRASARGMARLAEQAFMAGNFEDVAYFEPFYLKDFIITTSKK